MCHGSWRRGVVLGAQRPPLKAPATAASASIVGSRLLRGELGQVEDLHDGDYCASVEDGVDGAGVSVAPVCCSHSPPRRGSASRLRSGDALQPWRCLRPMNDDTTE